jgi:formate dehydrogenase assembly factor FdhD
MKNDKEFLISPDLENDNLTKEIEGFNEAGEYVKLPVVKEIPLTIYLNKQEIVTAMTLGDMPDLLAVGYLLNQNMLKKNDVIKKIGKFEINSMDNYLEALLSLKPGDSSTLTIQRKNKEIILDISF